MLTPSKNIRAERLTGSLDASGIDISGSLSITGSLFGTSSWAVSASNISSTSNAFIQGGNSFGTTATLGTNDNQNLSLETNGSNRIIITNDGNVGVGLNPSTPLHVSGTLRGNHNTSGNSSGKSDGFLEGFFTDIHPESGFPLIIPIINNDIAYTTLRGGSITLTPGPGSTLTFSNSQLQSLTNGAPDYLVTNPTSLSGSLTASIAFPAEYRFGNTIGFSFGNLSWRAKDFTVEILVTGSYYTIDTQTDYPYANYSKWFSVGAEYLQGARITFSNFQSPLNNTGFRIADIFLQNYTGQGIKQVFVGRDGGLLFDQLQGITGSATRPAFSTTGDTNTGIFFPSADTIAFTEGGVESMRINSSGNVGIGQSGTISAKLHINNTTTSNSFLVEDSANPDSTPFIIDNAGNVGIGTTSPESKLDVRAQGALSTDIAFRVRNSADTTDIFSVNGDGTQNWATVGNNALNSIKAGTFNIIQFGNNNFGNIAVGHNSSNMIVPTTAYNSVFGANASTGASSGFAVSIGWSSFVNAIGAINIGRTRAIGNYSIRIGYDGGASSYGGTNSIHLGKTVSGNNITPDDVFMTYFNSQSSSTLTRSNGSFGLLGQQAYILGNGGGTYGVETFMGNGGNTLVIRNHPNIPSTNITDSFQQYSADITAGNAAPHFRTENGSIIKLYKEIQPALSGSANTGDAATDALIEAMKTIILNLGLGASS